MNMNKRQRLVGDPDKPIYVKDMKMKDRLPEWVKVFTALPLRGQYYWRNC